MHHAIVLVRAAATFSHSSSDRHCCLQARIWEGFQLTGVAVGRGRRVTKSSSVVGLIVLSTVRAVRPVQAPSSVVT
jgi:hypothetical protein